ncbi:MAG: DUF455 family protein [Planctomycetaceae bacterium]|nr:DUF455 family protein [Planctomycetaceae bacterium]
MELRAFAERVLFSDRLDQKLERVREPFTDTHPGESLRVTTPTRPVNLVFGAPRTAPPMPSPNTFEDPQRRGIAHHIMANHELQALEVMAAQLLAYPEAPTDFRLGMARVMEDEQRHTRMHTERGESLGVPFGSRAVNSYIWRKSLEFRNILDYLAGLPLTFEGCNLDHTVELEEHFRRAGDPKSAAVMRQIHHDEIEHVAFGYQWLVRLKPAELSDWDAYVQHLHWPLRPAKSIGDQFQLDARLAAGLSPEFVEQLQTIALADEDA